MADRRQSRRGKTRRAKTEIAEQAPQVSPEEEAKKPPETPAETAIAGEKELVQSLTEEAATFSVEEKIAGASKPQAPRQERSQIKEEQFQMSPAQKEPGAAQARAGDSSSLLTSAAVIGIAALIEPELLAGMALGAGIVLASGMIGGVFNQVVGGVVRPVVKTAVRTGYIVATQVQEAVAEAREQVSDMVAEARAEHEGRATVH